MNHIKRICTIIVCLGIFSIFFMNIDQISKFILSLNTPKSSYQIPAPNKYKKETAFLFVQQLSEYKVSNQKELKNMFYTIVNNGWKEFTFYCPIEYKNCLDDVQSISQDQDLLTHINNFVHPFNSFNNIKTIINKSGEVTVSISYFYTKEQIDALNKTVDALYKELITPIMTNEEKIRTIHDYIINHSRYDTDENSTNHSYIAYGPLLEGYATCNGYTDAMALFLEELNIPNFKVATTPNDPTKEGHVWNAVFLNNTWYHLDLTWDDPVSSDGKDYLLDKYFLITTEELVQKETDTPTSEEHQFRRDIYQEFLYS